MELQALAPEYQEIRELDAIENDPDLQKYLKSIDAQIAGIYKSAMGKYTVETNTSQKIDVSIVYTHEQKVCGPQTFRVEFFDPKGSLIHEEIKNDPQMLKWLKEIGATSITGISVSELPGESSDRFIVKSCIVKTDAQYAIQAKLIYNRSEEGFILNIQGPVLLNDEDEIAFPLWRFVDTPPVQATEEMWA